MHGEWQVQVISCLIRPDRSAAARKLHYLNPTLSLPLLHSHSLTPLLTTTSNQPLCLAWPGSSFHLSPLATPASPPSSPIHQSCLPSSSFAISSCTLRGRAAVVFPLRYLVDLHTYIHTYTHTYIHTYICGPACLLTSSRLCCLPASASRRFHSIDTSSILIHQVSESAALSHDRDSCLVLPHTSFITSAYFPSSSSSSSSFCPLLHLLLAASSPSFSTSLLGWSRHEKERERCKHSNAYSLDRSSKVSYFTPYYTQLGTSPHHSSPHITRH